MTLTTFENTNSVYLTCCMSEMMYTKSRLLLINLKYVNSGYAWCLNMFKLGEKFLDLE